MINILFAAASVVIIIAGLKAGGEILGPILFAFTLTLLFTPLLRWLEKKKFPTWAAITVLSLGVISVFGVIILLVYTSAQQLITKLPSYQRELSYQFVPIQDSFTTWGITKKIVVPQEWLNGSAIAKTSLDFLTVFITKSTSIGLFLVTMFLMLIASDSVVKKYKRKFVKENQFAQDFNVWSKNIQHQYKIQTLSNLFSACIVTVTFLILRIDFAFLWGFLAFILAYIPNFGIILASIPPILLAFIQYGLGAAIVTAVVIIILNIIMDNFVTPRFMGTGLRVPPVVVFLSFIFWSWVFGLLGAFLALPITLALRSLLEQNKETQFVAEILTEDKDKQKDALQVEIK